MSVYDCPRCGGTWCSNINCLKDIITPTMPKPKHTSERKVLITSTSISTVDRKAITRKANGIKDRFKTNNINDVQKVKEARRQLLLTNTRGNPSLVLLKQLSTLDRKLEELTQCNQG